MKNTFTENMTAEMTNALRELDSDPKLQEVVAVFQKLPEAKQDTLLLMIDAFSAGMKAQKAIDKKAVMA